MDSSSCEGDINSPPQSRMLFGTYGSEDTSLSKALAYLIHICLVSIQWSDQALMTSECNKADIKQRWRLLSDSPGRTINIVDMFTIVDLEVGCIRRPTNQNVVITSDYAPPFALKTSRVRKYPQVLSTQALQAPHFSLFSSNLDHITSWRTKRSKVLSTIPQLSIRDVTCDPLEQYL